MHFGVMNRYVLFLVCLCAAAAALYYGSPESVRAEYFNETLIGRKAEKYFEGEEYEIPADDVLIEMKQESLGTNENVGPITVGLRPPEEFPRPQTVESDSIQIKMLRVKRTREVPGIRRERMEYIPLEQYKAFSLEDNREKLWRKNDTRMKAWEDRDDNQESDVGFSLPMGSRFENIMGGKTRLDISGSQRITFSGRSEWTEGQIETASSKNSSFPSLTMKQEPRFSIKGSVGERIYVDIDQDARSGSFSNLEENIKITYQGEENEIIQFIEAGNTSLNLEGATFAGYRGSHKGLFGIRGEGRLGPLKFTAIASQEKSEANTQSFRGSAEEKTTAIRDYDYKTNTYFFVDHVFRRQFETDRTSFDAISYNPNNSLSVLEVYVDDGINTNNLKDNTFALFGVAKPMVYDEVTDQIHDEAGIEGNYHKLDPQRDYYVDRDLGFIVFNTRVPDNWSVGVYIETGDGRTYGDLTYDTQDVNSKIELKLIKARNQRASHLDTWDLEWKNVYDLRQVNIDPEGLQIRIKREATEGVDKDNQNGTPFIHILGLDLQDEFGNEAPDNKIDINRGFVNLARGELIFPLMRPFDSSQTPKGVNTELAEKVPEIYDTQNQQEKEEASKYYIEVQTANQQATMQLPVGIGGILEGTEEVTADGKVLTKGTDYRINYMTGQVTLLSEAALNPSAQININYEEANAFQQMQKTLLGMRGEYDLWGESRLGATFLFNNESTRDKRVRLGQEPSRMALLDTDMQLNFQPDFLTTAVDKLPLVVANQTSRVRLEGEYAKSMPTMNTRGAVYIDDFEGSRNTPLNIIRTGWTPASKPDENSLGRAMTRGNFLWYNPWDRIESRAIWPNKETTTKENTVHVLNLAYGKPKDVPVDEGYGGIQTAFYGAGEDLSRARFIEVWARGNKGDLKIDIGSISEDFFPFGDANGYLDTEDVPVPGMGQGDGVLTKEEDTGLDGVFDQQETGYSASNPDPAGDNWRYKDKNDYAMINGMEGNAADSDRAGLPDTEDINRNGILDVKDSYYEYTISFDDPFDQYLVPDSVPEGNPAGWRLFRIPLWNNPEALVGGDTPPDSTLIEFARMWVTGVDTTLIQIASIEVVENNWLEDGIFKQDEDGEEQDVTNEVTDVIRVSRTNTDENLEYSPPPGVKVEIDPDTKVRRMEQSLVLIYENLDNGNTAYAYRQFDKMDFTDYTSLRMYVHGSEDMPLPAEGGRDVELVFRYGGDKENFYEIRTPIYRGWSKESYVDADFETATNVKLARDNLISEKNREKNLLSQEVQDVITEGGSQAEIDSLNTLMTFLDAEISDLNRPGAYADTVGTQIYTLTGSPSLQSIKVITAGVRNNKEVERITGEVWINELRMDEVRDMGGSAMRAKMTTDLAGFINIEGGVTNKSADFHDMNSKKGSGSDALDWNTSVKMNIDRFTPAKWNLSIPVSASTTESRDLPRLKSGSDIILNDQQREEEKAESYDRKYSISYRKGRDATLQGVKKHVIGWTMEKVDAAYHWGERDSSNPMSGEDTQVTQQLKLGYDVDPKERSVHFLKWLGGLPAVGEKMAGYEFTYTPKELNYNYTMDESERTKLNIDNVADTTHTKTGRHVYNFGYSPFKSFSYSYIRNTEDDLIISKETGFKETNNVTYKGPDLFKLITHNYTFRSTYNEDDNPRYSLSGSLGSKSIDHNEDFSANASISWDKMFEKLKTVPKQPDENEEKDGKDTEKKPEPKQAESDEGERDDENKEMKPPGEPIRNKVVMALANTVNPITLEYKKRDNLKYGGIADRPGFMTRFGSGTIDEPDSASVVTRQNSSSYSNSYVARTDFELPYDIGVQTRFSIDKEEKTTSSAFTRDEKTSYPDMTVRWRRVEKVLPMVSKYLTNLQIESGYSIDNTKSWRDESVEPLSDRTKKQFNPLINISTQVKRNISTSFTLSQSTEDSYDISGTTNSYSLTEQNDMRMQVRYRITSSKGFFGMKFKSDINLSLDFTTKGMERSKRIGEEELTLIEKTDSWSISPSAEYKFSQSFSGGASMDFSNAKDLTNKVHKVREVSIWGELKF